MKASGYLAPAAAFLALCLGLFFLCQKTPLTDTVPEAGVIMALPQQVGEFSGINHPHHLRVLGQDASFRKGGRDGCAGKFAHLLRQGHDHPRLGNGVGQRG
ncbi:MAG: hypothetical protein EBZ83_04460, partial [Verrucomicrobia bacterium]|nr:hypothetical protein [Verrucomicrobiota bacterium]